MPRKHPQEGVTLSITANERQLLYNIDLDMLGERIRRARIEKRVTQRGLTHNLFTSAYLSSLELGKTRPTPYTLSQLAERLDKSIAYFVHPVGEYGLPELNEEQDQVLQTLFTLQCAQINLAKANQVAASEQLNQVKLHLGWLNVVERARYHYFQATWYNQRQEFAAALPELTQAANFLLSTNLTEPAPTAVDATALELLILVEREWGRAEFGQKRLVLALGHYRRALELAIGDDALEFNPAQEQQSDQLAETLVPSQQQRRFLLAKLVWELHLAIANTYLALGEAPQAIHFLEETLSQAESAGFGGEREIDLAGQAFAVAASYQAQGDYAKASLYLGRSSQIYEQEATRQELTRLHSSLAQLHLQQGHYELAEQTAQTAVRLAQVGLGGTPTTLRLSLPAELTLVGIYTKQGKLAEASQLLTAILAVGEYAPASTRLELYQVAAELAADKGERDTAESFYHKALNLIEQPAANLFGPGSASLYYSYGQQLRKWGDNEKAFEYLDKALRSRQS